MWDEKSQSRINRIALLVIVLPVVVLLGGLILTTHRSDPVTYHNCSIESVKMPGFSDRRTVRVSTSCGSFKTSDRDRASRLKIGSVYDIDIVTQDLNGSKSLIIEGFTEVRVP